MSETVIDYITGRSVPDRGPEANRQLFERMLVEKKGYAREEIRVDEPITVQFKGNDYVSSIDLVVFCGDRAAMAVRCVAGSLGSYEREILAGARLLYDYQIPVSISTDGRNALVRDAVSGKVIGEGLASVPSRKEAETLLANLVLSPFPEEKKEREMIIFRSYNLNSNMND